MGTNQSTFIGNVTKGNESACSKQLKTSLSNGRGLRDLNLVFSDSLGDLHGHNSLLHYVTLYSMDTVLEQMLSSKAKAYLNTVNCVNYRHATPFHYLFLSPAEKKNKGGLNGELKKETKTTIHCLDLLLEWRGKRRS